MARKTVSRNAPDLHCHSTFSTLDGFGSPKSVVARAVELGWGAASLTEHGWMGSAPLFYQACRERKVKPILGCEFYVVPHEHLELTDKEYQHSMTHLTVLALSAEGYHNLVRWSSLSMQRPWFYNKPRISVEAMIESAKYPLHHNVVLSGCMSSELCRCLAELNGSALAAGAAYIDSMKTVFPNFYVEVQNHAHPKFVKLDLPQYHDLVAQETTVRAQLLRLAAGTHTPVVLTNDSHFQSSTQRKAHIAMLASKLNRWSRDEVNVVSGYSYWRNYMQSMEEIEGRTEGADGACANIMEIVSEADIRLGPLDDFSYSVLFSGHDDPIAEIRHRSRSRLKRLRSAHGTVVDERFEHELKSMGDFAHYLIMMSDFIRWAKSQGILTEVRGSANASVVCYCLNIHDVDSIKYKLTFERFVNPERKKLPDIDIDIEADRYFDFMEYVKEYVEEREGPNQVRLICNYGTLANRSTFRMVADSLGIDKDKQDEIAQLLPQMIDSGLVEEEADAYAMLKDTHPEIYELAADIFDNIKNVSQHACGWVFGTRDRPLDDWVPNYLIASSNQPVTQYDYKSVLMFGFNKGDFLRQKYLSVIKKCLTMLGQPSSDYLKIPLDDPDTMEMIRAGRTAGVFTLQGKTNRQGVMEVEPEDEHGVIAAVAIYRPSLTRPGYHNVYNARRRGDEEVSFPHPIAEKILGESYGLPIFQEHILDLGYGVGMDHVEAQELLDAIKEAKGIGRHAAEAFARVRPKFLARCRERGMSDKEAEATWELVGSFKGYGFNRAHATGYGLRSDRSAYLKCHHPQEFFVSLLDVYPEKGEYVAAAKAEGFKLLAPDINLSGAGFSKGTDAKSIRVGLARVDGVGPKALEAILAGQPFSSLDDLKERTPGTAVKVPTINNLGAVGAFRSFGVRATDDDTETLGLLGFLPDKPRALEQVGKVAHANKRDNNGWLHLGLDRDVQLTAGMKASVSKLFWIPEWYKPDKEGKKDKLLQLKSSPMGHGKSWLLTAVDENGIAFDIKVDERKTAMVEYLKWMERKCRGAVICLDGAVRSPFDKDRPLSFTLFDVTGAFHGEPQLWGVENDKIAKAFNVLHKRKRRAAA
jgi:DNA polymerase-3 subunit alpha